MSLGRRIQDPDASRTHTLDLTDWLAGLGGSQTLASAAWSVTPSGGLTVASSAVTGPLASVKLSGGSVGAVYVVTCHFLSSGGEEDDRSFEVLIRHL
jgi:hypothetical protein